ncbi:hypothetical protein SAMN05660297_01403 [Natronincola peptidivorans]|uniref:Uncharacterized protein n=1 Tax=Natronincola peptidivorans TaxID=426128 RepID=A0A1I0BTF8_9FIRM|nr:hypothetical protein [Natronincola peptidivorans]SET10040.1 hypothetical protein SAMN05660297_01403 [Natronincola peptidivorans]
MRIKIDKMIALCGSALLGYYLGLSILGGTMWRLLQWTLPPINDRHLPRFYTGIMGAVIAASIGYLIYTKFIEKCSIKKCRKQYTIGIVALLLLPMITMVSFRIQAVNYVKQAEATTPTRLNLQFENPRVSFVISESHGGASATAYGKSIRVENQTTLLEEFGETLQQLELVEVVDPSQYSREEHRGTMWINYSPKGSWYSKILTWHGDYFVESIAGQQWVLYKGTALEALLKDLDSQLKDLNTYTSAEMLHTTFIDGKANHVESVPIDNLEFIKNSIQKHNRITPDDDIVSSFEVILKDHQWITKADVNFYGFSLKNHLHDTSSFEVDFMLENVLLYDDVLKIAWFEGEYYEVDLSPLIN